MLKQLVRLGALLFIAVAARAQNAALLPFTTGTITGTNGLPCSGCLLYTYIGGTTTPKATYTDSTAGTPKTNPVVVNVFGLAFVWGTNAPYRLVLTDPMGATIWTVDNVLAAGFGNTGPWTTSGTSIYNTSGGRVCVSNAACTTPLAQLNVVGNGGGQNLIRIDDAGNNPGISLYGSGSLYGSYDANNTGLHLRSSDSASQVTVAPGLVTIQNSNGAAATHLVVQAGTTQGTTDLLTFNNPAGTPQAGVDYLYRAYSPLFNSTCTGSAIAYQTTNSNYSVDCLGDISASGQLNLAAAGGVTAGPTNLLKIGGTTVIDNNRNAFVANLTVSGTCTGCGGGGGGGSGTVTPSAQYNVGVYSASGTANTINGNTGFTYNLSTKQATIASTGTGGSTIAALTITGGYVQTDEGFNTTGTDGAAIQALNGGMAAKSFTWIQESAPSPANSGQATTYMDSSTKLLMLSRDTGSFYRVATANGTLINGHCVSIDSTGNFVDAGGACTTGGGGGTVSSATQYQVAYYTGAGTGTTVGGSSNYTFNASTNTLTVTGAGIITNGAFNSSATGGATAIQVNSGAFGVLGNGTVSALTLQLNGGTGTGLNVSTNTDANSIQSAGGANTCVGGSCVSGIAYEVNGNKVVDSSRNGFFNNLTVTGTCTGCGGGGGGGITSINTQTGAAITITGTTNQINVSTPTTNTINIATPQNINTGANPTFAGMTLTGISGAGVHCAGVNNSGTFNVGTGYCVDSIAGTANEIIVSASTGPVTLSTPQPIATSSTPTFAGVITTGTFNSSGSGTTFQNSNSRFSVNNNGDITISGVLATNGGVNVSNTSSLSIQTTGGITASGGYKVAGTNTILDSSGDVVAGTRYYVNNGTTYTGQTWTIGFGSSFSINGGGSFTQLVFVGGILVGAI